MRHFTKTHNDLKWLFPVAETEKEAEKIFDSAETQAKDLLSLAGVKKNDEDRLKQLDNLFHELPATARNELDQLVNKRDASKPPYNTHDRTRI